MGADAETSKPLRLGLRGDLVAGLTVAAVALPQAMAYAPIAGVDPVYGLYTAIVMTALASVFGSSRHLITGPTTAISLVVRSAVAGLWLGDPARYHQAVFFLTFLVGLLQLVIYDFELVALTQLPNLLGLESVKDGSHNVLWRLGRTLAHARAIDSYSLALGLAT